MLEGASLGSGPALCRWERVNFKDATLWLLYTQACSLWPFSVPSCPSKMALKTIPSIRD